MDYIKYISDFWHTLTESDFDYGFSCGVLLCLGIIFIFLILKVCLKLTFRRRRCKQVVVNPKDKNGGITIQVKAIEQAIREEISKLHSISVNSVKMYRIKTKYILVMSCAYDGKSGNIIEIRSKMNDKIFMIFKDFLGIDSLKSIDLTFEKTSFESYLNSLDEKDENSKIEVNTVELVDNEFENITDDDDKYSEENLAKNVK